MDKYKDTIHEFPDKPLDLLRDGNLPENKEYSILDLQLLADLIEQDLRYTEARSGFLHKRLAILRDQLEQRRKL